MSNNASNDLYFGGEIRNPDIRMLYDMADVIYDKEWLDGAENIELYYMYRDLSKSREDLDIIQKNDLRYDITVIPANMLGLEYVKTAGHYHPFVPGTDTSYTEVYQVLEGAPLYLLQKVDSKTVLDVITIRAVAGDVVLIPPNYGHITINRSNVPLKMANWVCRNFSSIYDPIKELSGGAYYLLKDGFMKNHLYNSVPSIRELEPMDVPELGLVCGEDMYELVHDIEKLEILKNPTNFMEIFSRILR